MCLATSIASAGPDDELRPPKERPPTSAQRRAARKHYSAASKAFRSGDYKTALDELHGAYDAEPRPEYLYSIAQVHLKQNHCIDATVYLQRYLETRPGPTAARSAALQIDTCKKQQPTENPKPVKLDSEPRKLEPEPEPEPEPVKQPEPPPKRTAKAGIGWFSDRTADYFVIGGATSGVLASLLYVSALGELDAAEGSPTLEEHIDHFDTARSRRLYSLVLGGAGVALATFGVVHFIRYDRRERRHAAVVPTSGGAMAVVTGSF